MKGLALILAAVLLGFTGCLRTADTPLYGLSPQSENSIRSVAAYRGPLESQGLAYALPSGEVVIRYPWFSSPQIIGSLAPWAVADWGYDPEFAQDGTVVPLHKLLYVTPESRIMELFLNEGTPRTLPIDVGSTQVLAGYSPSGEFITVAYPQSDCFRLALYESGSGERWQLELDKCTKWMWSPSNRWLALAVPSSRETGTDLALIDPVRGRITVLVGATPDCGWEPYAWASDSALCYRCEPTSETGEPTPETGWIDILTALVPDEVPKLPLEYDTERVASLVPRSLAGEWTGEYAVSSDEQLLAIVCEDGGGPSVVYVGVVLAGEWFLAGEGDRPTWTQWSPGGQG